MKPTKLSRKLRRGFARTYQYEFQPQYNGKEPITFAKYIEGFRENTLPRRLRNHPLNKAVKA